jgi:drug/metabolite transporter (DMT)-like permease
VLLAIVAAALFAGSFVSGKIAYDRAEFLGVFVLSRVFVGLAGLSVGWLDGKARQELLSLFSFGGAPTRHRHATVLTIIAQLLGATGFVLLNVAIAEGSAAIVNALQAIQYTAIVLVAWFGGKQISALLQEQRTPLIFILKTAAIILVAIGLRLVSSPYQG